MVLLNAQKYNLFIKMTGIKDQKDFLAFIKIEINIF